MRRVLHILTRAEDSLAQEIIRSQQNRPELEVEVVDLAQGEPDYGELVEKIFQADGVAVW